MTIFSSAPLLRFYDKLHKNLQKTKIGENWNEKRGVGGGETIS